MQNYCICFFFWPLTSKKYFYRKKYNPNGDKLITELTPDYRVDYLYDENDQSYEFIKDNEERYLYIRDYI